MEECAGNIYQCFSPASALLLIASFPKQHRKASISHPHCTPSAPARRPHQPRPINTSEAIAMSKQMDRDTHAQAYSYSESESERSWTANSQSNSSSSEDEEPDQAVEIMEYLFIIISNPPESSPTPTKRLASEPHSPWRLHFDAESITQRPSSTLSDPPSPSPPSPSCSSYWTQDRGRTRFRKAMPQPRDRKNTPAPRYTLTQRMQRSLDKSLDMRSHVPENRAETPAPEADKPYPASATDKLEHHIDEDEPWGPLTWRRRGAVVVGDYAALEGALPGRFVRSAC